MSTSEHAVAAAAPVSAAELEIDRVYAPLYETCQQLLAMEAMLPADNDAGRIFHSEASFVAPDMAEFQNLVKTGVAQWREFRDCVKAKPKPLRKVWVPRVRTIKDWLKGLQDKASSARGVVVLETYIPAGETVHEDDDDDDVDEAAAPIDAANTQLAMSMLAAPQQGQGPQQAAAMAGGGGDGGAGAMASLSGAWASFDQLVAAVSTAASSAAITAGSVAGTVASSVSSLVASAGDDGAGDGAAAGSGTGGGVGVLVAPAGDEPLAEVDVLRRNWYNRAQRRRLRFFARGWQRVDPDSGAVREAFEYASVTGVHVHAYRRQLAVQLREHAAEWYEGEGTARVLLLLQGHCHKLAVEHKP